MFKHVQSLLDTVDHLPINELKDGGHFSGKRDRIGGYTCSRTWSIITAVLFQEHGIKNSCCLTERYRVFRLKDVPSSSLYRCSVNGSVPPGRYFTSVLSGYSNVELLGPYTFIRRSLLNLHHLFRTFSEKLLSTGRRQDNKRQWSTIHKLRSILRLLIYRIQNTELYFTWHST